MAKIHCRLLAHSNSKHVQQLYTGLSILHRNGVIRLSQEVQRQGRLLNHARVLINDRIRLHYDMFDGAKIDEPYLDEADLYFKRTFAPQHLQLLGIRREKIFPLGLYYSVYPDHACRSALKRALLLRGNALEKARNFLRSGNLLNSLFFTPRIKHMQSAPITLTEPRILFMTRTWDPYDNPHASKDLVEDRFNINESRAECIRSLRAEFGARFYGGFAHTKDAAEKYKDLLVPDPSLTPQRRYLDYLQKFSICVTTTGLHGSIGGKFAEYIALSKAIVTEAFDIRVPGQLEPERNFLSFDNPEQCVEAAARLYNDPDLRYQMMISNYRYYHHYLRPDALVLNSLITALSIMKPDLDILDRSPT